MEQSNLRTVSDAISLLADFNKKNATVISFKQLREESHWECEKCLNTIHTFLSKLNMHKFISLVRPNDRAAIAIVLNAGDGIVAKITTKTYLSQDDEMMPGRLPSIHRFPPIGQSEEFPYIVEIFP